MAYKVNITPDDYCKAAIKYRKELLYIPVYTLGDFRKYCTDRPGVRYEERVGSLTGTAEFAPYDPDRVVDPNIKVAYRALKTYFGSVVARFEPNSVIAGLLGEGAQHRGEGQKQSGIALAVLRKIAETIGEGLYNHIWDAVRNADGQTTKDLFDGFDTITAAEITAGAIAADKGNYVKATAKVTSANCMDFVRQNIVRKLHPKLRQQTAYLHCTQDFYDMYCEGYLLTHGATPYNDKYEQTVVEGTNGKLILVPHPNKDGSKYIHVTTKDNLLIGYDQLSDEETVEVEKHSAFKLDYVATTFFGVQFESVAPERLFVCELLPEA